MTKTLIKFITLSLLPVCFSTIVYAQNSADAGKITSKIIDSASHLPVDYATVNLYLQGSKTPFRVSTSDPKGDFSFTGLPFGEYSLSIGFMGYRSYTALHILISKQKPAVTLRPILLVSVEKILKGVNITAQTPAVQNKMDKLVYDPSNDLSAQGGSAIDILKKVPMLTVDINGNVELLGSSGINFLINGKPSSAFGASLTDALQSIPASQIKNIEVISNPGARYDAQGTGGVINIILKDNNVSGVNGTANLSAGTRQNNGSFNLNARKNNFGVNTFFSGNMQGNTTSLNSKRLTNSDNIDLLNQNGSSNIKRNGYQTGLSLNWKVTPKDDLTATIGYNRFDNHTSDLSDQAQTSFDTSGQPLHTGSNRNADNVTIGKTLQWSVAYKKQFKKEDQVLDILYQSDINDNVSSYSQLQQYSDGTTPALGTSSYSPGRVRETGVELNYAQPVSKNFMIETGGKAFFKTINSVVDAQQYDNTGQTYIPDPSQSYAFRYDRNIFAYYLSAAFKAFDFFDIKAGARYEYTVTHADFANTNIPGYGSFNPSIVISHRLDDSQTLKISYSHRIERPDYSDLNPFVNRSDPYNVSAGNPDLRPELGNNMEAGYSKSFKGGAAINLNAFYRRNGDDIQNYTIFYPVYQEGDATFNNVSYTSRTNTGGEKRVGANIYTSVPVTDKLTLRSNILVSTRDITYDFNGLNQSARGTEYRLNLNAAYQFPKDLSAEVFGNYNSPRVGLQGKNASFLFYTMALRKRFFNKKASIGLSATDPFTKYINQSSTIYQTGNKQYTLRQVPYRSFGITLSYKFGNLKFDKKDKPKDEPNVPQTL